jgi:hypothetical protein
MYFRLKKHIFSIFFLLKKSQIEKNSHKKFDKKMAKFEYAILH